MTDDDVALAITDPEGRLVGGEFQTLFGRPVRYNHNGWSHFTPAAGKRFSIYRITKIARDEMKLVCWLATPQSVIRTPIHLEHLPIPSAH